MKKNGFLFQVDILKWEKFINAQEITTRLHYCGVLLFQIAEEYISLLKTKKKNV